MNRVVTAGDAVLFEGLAHSVVAVGQDRFEFESELTAVVQRTQADGSKATVVEPRFRTLASLSDARWSDELKAWYIWGRVLNRGRGDVGEDQRTIVAQLRDRGLLIARKSRNPGDGPAGGEHVNLYVALFSNGIKWRQELANVARGEGLSDAARAAISDYSARFTQKLPDGYGAPGANDSFGEG